MTSSAPRSGPGTLNAPNGLRNLACERIGAERWRLLSEGLAGDPAHAARRMCAWQTLAAALVADLQLDPHSGPSLDQHLR